MGGATDATMRVRMERSPAQKANLATFVRALRAVEARVTVLRGQGQEMPKPTPEWATWCVKVGEQVIGKLPRGEAEVVWNDTGLQLLGVTAGAELYAAMDGGM